MDAAGQVNRRAAALPPYRSPTARELLRFGLPLFVVLRRLERSSSKVRRRYQERNLRKVVARAARLEGYRSLLSEAGVDPRDVQTLEDLPSLPILGRKQVRLLAAEAWSNATTSRKHLGFAHTSGSSGEPLAIPLDRRETAIGQALVLYGFMRSGVRPTDRLGHLVVPTTAPRRRLLERVHLLREQRIDLRDGPERNLDELAACDPDVVYAYPSHLALVAGLLDKGDGSSIRPRLVVTHGETLTRATRSRLEIGFSCPVRDTYGSAEFNRIAFECPHGQLHTLPTTFVETDAVHQDKNGGAEVLVTSLYHTTVPLLRYRLG